MSDRLSDQLFHEADSLEDFGNESTVLTQRVMQAAVARLREIATALRQQEETGLRPVLEKATVRLEILKGRMVGCDDAHNVPEFGGHALSRLEIDGWVEEQRALLKTEPETR